MQRGLYAQGSIAWGSGGGAVAFGLATASANSGAPICLQGYTVNTANATCIELTNQNITIAPTTGTTVGVDIGNGAAAGGLYSMTFHPTSGSASFVGLQITPVINASGSSGSFTALKVEPDDDGGSNRNQSSARLASWWSKQVQRQHSRSTANVSRLCCTDISRDSRNGWRDYLLQRTALLLFCDRSSGFGNMEQVKHDSSIIKEDNVILLSSAYVTTVQATMNGHSNNDHGYAFRILSAARSVGGNHLRHDPARNWKCSVRVEYA